MNTCVKNHSPWLLVFCDTGCRAIGSFDVVTIKTRLRDVIFHVPLDVSAIYFHVGVEAIHKFIDDAGGSSIGRSYRSCRILWLVLIYSSQLPSCHPKPHMMMHLSHLRTIPHIRARISNRNQFSLFSTIINCEKLCLILAGKGSKLST